MTVLNNSLKNEYLPLKDEVLQNVCNMCKAERIIVTGSTALYKMGVVREASDLDIILVNPDNPTKEVLLFWQKEFPAKTKAPTGSRLFAIFNLKGIKVDIFIQKDYREQTIKTYAGYEIASVKGIVDAKMSYKRLKDWLQLQRIALSIFDESKFQKWLKDTPIALITKSKEEY